MGLKKKKRIIAFVNATDICILRIVSKGRIDFLSPSEIDLGNQSPDHRMCLIDRTVIGFHTLTNEHTYTYVYARIILYARVIIVCIRIVYTASFLEH